MAAQIDEEKYEILTVEKNFFYPMQKDALELVQEFVSNRELLIYGGLAIHYAALSQSSSLYEQHVLPDFDVFSSNHAQDAYDMADILVRAGYKGVDAIVAFHPTTMRVRINYTVVLDISYRPPDVLAIDKQNAIRYKQLYVVNPHMQLIDMHLSLCMPYRGAPMENAINRYKKDIVRYGLLLELYPLAEPTMQPVETKTCAIPLDKAQSLLVCGFSAYAYYLQELAKFVPATESASIPQLKFELGGGKLQSEIPVGTSLIFGTTTQDILATYKPEAVMRPFLDLKPRSYLVNIGGCEVEFWDMAKTAISCNMAAGGLTVANIQHTMLYMLYLYFYRKFVPGMQYYLGLLRMIKLAESAMTAEEFGKSVFYISQHVYGSTIFDERFYMTIEGTDKKLPGNYYPGQAGKMRPLEYNYSQVDLFSADGREYSSK